MVKLNILFDVTKLYKTDDQGFYRTGIFWVTYNLLKKFLNDDVYNVTLYSEYTYPKDNFDTVDIDIQNVDYIASKYIINLGNVKKQIENKKFNAENYDLYFNSAFFSKLDNDNVPQFYILHDAIPMILSDKYPKQFIDNFKDFYSNLSNKINCFCISESCKKDFLRFFSNLNGDNMTLISNASSQEFKPLKNPNIFETVKRKYNIHFSINDKYIFTISNLADKKKNLCFTIKNFFNFIKTNNINNLYFVLAGYGKDYLIDEIKQISQKDYEHYKDKLIFLGYLPDNDVNIFYSNSLYFSFISLYEGFGLPLLEAMQAGTPILTSNTSSIPEVVLDAAIKISPNNDAECIKAMDILYNNEQIRKELIQKGYNRKNDFSWEKTYEIIDNKIKNVLKI